ncbi:MAG TPA: sulfite exporter TauE/SafE family protein [Nocardioidaceae bacterium]
MDLSLTLVVVLALSLLIGVSLGVLGGGGSILTVPILVYVAGMEPKEAIAASLFVVGVTSAAGAVSHARGGRVRWRTGLLFGAAGLVGAFLGGLLGGHLPGTLLLVFFALMMVATSIAMIRGRRSVDESQRHSELPVLRVLLDGLVVGLVTGLVGAGGGFLVVPALALLGGLPMAVAVGTSLLVIAMKSLGGLFGYLSAVSLDWPLVIAVTVAAILGSVVGGRLAGRIPETALRKGFGWFVLVMGGFVLVQQAPAGLAVPIIATVVALGLAAGACWKFVSSCPLRRDPAHA